MSEGLSAGQALTAVPGAGTGDVYPSVTGAPLGPVRPESQGAAFLTLLSPAEPFFTEFLHITFWLLCGCYDTPHNPNS